MARVDRSSSLFRVALLPPHEKTKGGLPGGGRRGGRFFGCSTAPRHKSAVVAPGECAPRAVPLPLVAHIGRLLKILIVVDSENTPVGREETCPVVSHRRVPLKTLDICRAQA